MTELEEKQLVQAALVAVEPPRLPCLVILAAVVAPALLLLPDSLEGDDPALLRPASGAAVAVALLRAGAR